MTEPIHPLDTLVNTLREEWQKLCAYLTDLDEATTALTLPGGPIKEVRHALWNILECYMRAGLSLENFVDSHPEWKE